MPDIGAGIADGQDEGIDLTRENFFDKGHQEAEIMPTDACRFFCECKAAALTCGRTPETAVSIAVSEQFRVHQSNQTIP